MNEDNSQEQSTNKTTEKPWLFQKGNPGGPGRPTGKTMKEFQAEMFRLMTDEQKIEWLQEHKVSGETRWKMAEGNPKNDIALEGEIDMLIKIDG